MIIRTMYSKKNIAIAAFALIAACVLSCKEGQKTTPGVNQIRNPSGDQLSLVIAMDTLKAVALNELIIRQNKLNQTDSNSAFYHFFRGKQLALDKKYDNAQAEYHKMKSLKKDDEIDLLKNLMILSPKLSYGSMVEAPLMNQIFSNLKTAEQNKSKLTYRYYDLIAQAYFQNHNERKSLEYAAQYFKAHPFKSHRVVKQRYFDISFLLASRIDDFAKMAYYNNQARILAIQINDSLALARTYDNQSQIYSKQGQTAKALQASRTYFSYLKKNDQLNDIAFNNLATAFVRNGQPDSAIYYYRAGIALEKKDPSGKRKSVHYQGLIDAYKLKGDYKSALQAADSVYTIETRNNKAIEAGNVAEMHEKYETEKKDRSIRELNSRNQLNETVIRQQRWSMFLIIIIFLIGTLLFIIIYSQMRLRDKNKLLAADNQRLVIEQKLLQAQLNPHFIFNAIANLQGLISSGNTIESVRYLKSFSGLLRAILEQNRKEFIEIDEEITSLRHYLQLQQMRYTGAFDYQITLEDEIDGSQTFIPPMLIQPFVENAIEHGFRNLPYKGKLEIRISQNGSQLEITVDDNGSGLKTKETANPAKQSLAQTILSERLEAMFGRYGKKACFKLHQKTPAEGNGVRVNISLPFIND